MFEKMWLMKKKNFILSFGCFILINNGAFADNLLNQAESQAIANKISQLNNATRMMCTPQLRCSLSLTTQFYSNFTYQPVWIQNSKVRPEVEEFLEILRNSYQEGLNPFDYHVKEIKDLLQQIKLAQQNGQVVPASVLANLDVTLSDAYLLYSKHLEVGRIDPSSAYPDWQVSRRQISLLDQYTVAVKQNNLISNLNKIKPNFVQYTALKQKLASYQKIAEAGGWESIPIGKDLRLSSSGSRVRLLQQRLALTQDYNLPNEGERVIFDAELKASVSKFQAENGIKATGVVDKTTLQSLNISVEARIKQIQLNLDRLRWLPPELGSKYVWVNIPSYSLAIKNKGSNELVMPVIVGGGGENKTCIVNSRITTLELNPYWGIPNRIATKEYLAKIQKDPEYLNKHNIRVFSTTTKNEVDPTLINWESVSPNKFNYFLRQDPGKKNALGKVKFLFPNDCGIYLHDTSNPNLFDRKARSLSHGCVRVSQPLELADYLITSNANWSDAKLESAIKSGEHKWLKLTEPLPIHIVYQTAWVDESGKLQFRKDIYKADNVDFPVFIPKNTNE